jgi:hypothetical protein
MSDDDGLSRAAVQEIVAKALENALGGLLPKIRAVVFNPRRFVLGIVTSSIVSALLATLLLGVNLGRWLAGFPVAGSVTVDGTTIDVPWCSTDRCDITSFVDIPRLIGESLGGGVSAGGDQVLRALGGVWTGLPTGGLLGPLILAVLAGGAILALVWIVRLLIAVSPVSLP